MRESIPSCPGCSKPLEHWHGLQLFSNEISGNLIVCVYCFVPLELVDDRTRVVLAKEEALENGKWAVRETYVEALKDMTKTVEFERDSHQH